MKYRRTSRNETPTPILLAAAEAMTTDAIRRTLEEGCATDRQTCILRDELLVREMRTKVHEHAVQVEMGAAVDEAVRG